MFNDDDSMLQAALGGLVKHLDLRVRKQSGDGSLVRVLVPGALLPGFISMCRRGPRCRPDPALMDSGSRKEHSWPGCHCAGRCPSGQQVKLTHHQSRYLIADGLVLSGFSLGARQTLLSFAGS